MCLCACWTKHMLSLKNDTLLILDLLQIWKENPSNLYLSDLPWSVVKIAPVTHRKRLIYSSPASLPGREMNKALQGILKLQHTRLFTIIFSSSLLMSANVCLLSGSCFQHRSMRLYLEKRTTVQVGEIQWVSFNPPSWVISPRMWCRGVITLNGNEEMLK